jgi:hypothetical protein
VVVHDRSAGTVPADRALDQVATIRRRTRATPNVPADWRELLRTSTRGRWLRQATEAGAAASRMIVIREDDLRR